MASLVAFADRPRLEHARVVHAQRVVADELDRRAVRRLGVHGRVPQVHLAVVDGEASRGAGALPLLRHQLLEARLVHRQPALPRHHRGEVRRKAVRVVQQEAHIPRDAASRC